MNFNRSLFYLSVSSFGIVLTTLAVQAQQVVPDTTLNTIVASPNNLDFTITGGGTAGPNLFHSFTEFSIPTGGSALFDNALNIQNIFTRITGPNISNLDGALKANGTANLFLLNPKGVIFGPNASLNIGGSFLTTTANTIKFTDGSEFSATNLTTPTPVLTVSVPIGLQFGPQANAITDRATNLQVQSGQTIGLLGGDLTIAAGSLSAPGGRVELGSVGPTNIVAIHPTTTGFTLGYGNSQTFQDIQISQLASVNASGTGGGAIQLQGRRINITGGSDVTSDTTGAATGQGIAVQASESLVVQGVSPNAAALLDDANYDLIPTRLRAYVRKGATGAGGDITIVTPNLQVTDGAAIRASTYGKGDGGNIALRSTNIGLLGQFDDDEKLQSGLYAMAEKGSAGKGGKITIDAQDIAINSGIIRGSTRAGTGGDITIRANTLTIDGAQQSESVIGGITTSSRETATGKGGNIDINVQNLQLRHGAGIRTGAYGQGDAGNLVINTKQLDITGIDQSAYASGIFTTVNRPTATGKGGNININSDVIRVFDAGFIDTSTIGLGNAGNLSLNAQLVEVAGNHPDITRATALKYPLSSQIIARSSTSGNAGSLQITSDRLNLYDSGLISVSSTGSGNPGNLRIQSNIVRLDSQGSLQANVQSGSQGNIQVDSNVLLLRGTSQITTNASNESTGGRINLNANAIIQLENSDITANALRGQGGSVDISTRALLGGVFRSRLTPESDITASSEFGISGNVQVNTIGVAPNSGLVELPGNLVDPSQQIATGCNRNQGASFVITGRGGVPINPVQMMNTDRPWQDPRNIPTNNIASNISPPPLIEATTWQLNPQGQPQLVAGTPIAPPKSITCAQ
jgi:filamentous hemagglutinin family protein